MAGGKMLCQLHMQNQIKNRMGGGKKHDGHYDVKLGERYLSYVKTTLHAPGNESRLTRSNERVCATIVALFSVSQMIRPSSAKNNGIRRGQSLLVEQGT
jgi:hypothetical protein